VIELVTTDGIVVHPDRAPTAIWSTARFCGPAG